MREVRINRERFSDSDLLHHDEAQTVDEAVGLAMSPLPPGWFRQNPETLTQTGSLDARIIVQLYRPSAMPANIVIDTSAILAVLLAEPEKQAVVEATMGSVLCAPASLRWEVGNAATAGVKRRRLTPERARQLVTDLEQVTIRELAVDLRRAVDLGLELGIYAYDAYILEGARSSGFPLVALDGPIRRNAKKLGLSLVELDL
jgi:predicted nucleic acid-binding protein